MRDGGGSVVVAYGYDGLGRRTSLTRDNGAVTSWSYDAAGRLATLTDNAAGAAHDRAVTFSYNPAGQIVGRSDSNDAFAFTALANQGVTDSHNGLNQVVTAGSTNVLHDLNVARHALSTRCMSSVRARLSSRSCKAATASSSRWPT